MNHVLEEMYRQRRVVGRSGKSFALFPCAIGWHKGRSLYEWIRRTKPQTTLETGCAFGTATLFICQALSDNGAGVHHVMDPFESAWWDSIGLDHMRQAGLDSWMRFYEQPSHVQLPQLLETGLHVDLAFLDGQHLFDYVLVECFYVDLMLSVGGILVLDDSWMPSVRRVASFLIRNRGYRLVNYTNRLLQGRPAPSALRAMAHTFLKTPWLLPGASTLFRFESLLYLQKTRDDDRPWDWHRDF